MPIFVIHEHHAKHLHFDLRLEIDGVLKSFALPKGPSMNPKDKRLAIMVDDHPISYADFEGIIPEGFYGAGYVVIWDRGVFSVQKGDLKAGLLEINFNGNILKGMFILKKLPKNDKSWLFFKKNDKFSNPDFELNLALTEDKKKTLKKKVPECQLE
ncbi:MAG: 3'-phosphoesterase [Proteobacteria bacterium]|nr:3'-phosphoesterase [Pseudomonadota bacterium]